MRSREERNIIFSHEVWKFLWSEKINTKKRAQLNQVSLAQAFKHESYMFSITPVQWAHKLMK